MNYNETFTYQYSAERNKEVEKIRKKYMPRETDKVALLKSLDLRVQTAGVLQGLTIGILGCLLFGVGMCFGLDVFSGADWLSLLFGGLGVALMIPAWILYTKDFPKKPNPERSAP